jgi:GNAT superfamily N-acetyltransferase
MAYETPIESKNPVDERRNNMPVIRIKKDNLSTIKHLWEKLRDIHFAESRHFKDRYINMTFEMRCHKFEFLDDDNLLIELIRDGESTVAYCISSIKEGIGEIDSLFVEETHRNRGYGKQLVDSAIIWINQNNCEKIILSVADGHESVLPFYEKLGFFPESTLLQLRKTL